MALLASSSVSVRGVASAEEVCQHPYPCGNEWPADLASRRDFTLQAVTSVSIPSRGADGVETLLDGWLAMPKLPARVKAPTVTLQPLLGPALWSDSSRITFPITKGNFGLT